MRRRLSQVSGVTARTMRESFRDLPYLLICRSNLAWTRPPLSHWSVPLFPGRCHFVYTLVRKSATFNPCTHIHTVTQLLCAFAPKQNFGLVAFYVLNWTVTQDVNLGRNNSGARAYELCKANFKEGENHARKRHKLETDSLGSKAAKLHSIGYWT